MINSIRILLLVFLIIISFVSCNSKNDIKDHIIIESNKLDPVFLSVIDSFIQSSTNDCSNIFIQIYSDDNTLKGYIGEVDDYYIKQNKTMCSTNYMNRKVFFYTSLDGLIIKNQNDNMIRINYKYRCWYVEFDKIIGINEAGLSNRPEIQLKTINKNGTSLNFISPE